MGLLRHEGVAIKQSEFTYFFVEADQIESNIAVFSIEESRHIVKVGRMKAGDRIYATDGTGRACEMVIQSATPSRVTAEVTSITKPEAYPFSCTLAVPLTTGQKLDLIVEKVTELGANEILLFECQRAKSRSPSEKKIERLRRVTVAAMKQSMRVFLPEVRYVGDFNSVLDASRSHDVALFGDMADTARRVCEPIHDSRPKSVLIVVGPEAGFTEEEITALRAADAVGVRVGDHRLRSETAAITLTGLAIDALFAAYNM